MDFNDSIKLSNIKENWLFSFANNNSGFIRIAFSDVVYDGNFYHGCILNNPSVRESINLEKSTTQTSNVSLTLADFDYKGSKLSTELFGGSNSYINRSVSVLCQINNETPIDIGSFRLTTISSNGQSINVSMSAHRPFDYITMPTGKTTLNNIPIPVSYGDYTENPATTFASPLFDTEFTSTDYRPVPFNTILEGKVLYVDGVSTTTSGELAVYEKGIDKFVPLESPVANNSSSVDGTFQDKSNIDQIISYKLRADTHTQVSTASDIVVANEDRAIDGNTSNYASYSVVNKGESSDSSHKNRYTLRVGSNPRDIFKNTKTSSNVIVKLDGSLNTTVTDIDVTSGSSFQARDIIKVDDEQMIVNSISSNTLSVTRGFNSKSDSHDDNAPIETNSTVNIVNVLYEIVASSSNNVGNNVIKVLFSTDGGSSQVSRTVSQSQSGAVTKTTFSKNIFTATDNIDITIEFESNEITVNGTEVPPTMNAEVRIYDVYTQIKRGSEEPKDMLYVANDGLTKGITGESGAITLIQDAHLDLLNRFTGLDVASNPSTNIDGFSALDSARANWNIRYWTLEAKSLIKVLEQMQFEGCFIFRYKNGDATKPQYIHIANSPSTDEVITKNDISSVKLSTTSFSSIITKKIINYDKHPAEDRYFNSITVSDTTNNPRTAYNIQSLENIQEVKLDMLTNSIGATNAGSGNRNDGFSNYYNAISGTIKLEINFKIVNPRFYELEVGNIIEFDENNMFPTTPFGHNSATWNGLKMIIVSTGRTLGNLSIKAREI